MQKKLDKRDSQLFILIEGVLNDRERVSRVKKQSMVRG